MGAVEAAPGPPPIATPSAPPSRATHRLSPSPSRMRASAIRWPPSSSSSSSAPARARRAGVGRRSRGSVDQVLAQPAREAGSSSSSSKRPKLLALRLSYCAHRRSTRRNAGDVERASHASGAAPGARAPGLAYQGVEDQVGRRRSTVRMGRTRAGRGAILPRVTRASLPQSRHHLRRSYENRRRNRPVTHSAGCGSGRELFHGRGAFGCQNEPCPSRPIRAGEVLVETTRTKLRGVKPG